MATKKVTPKAPGSSESKKAAATRVTKSVKNVKNLKGGILDWSDKIDPSVPKY